MVNGIVHKTLVVVKSESATFQTSLLEFQMVFVPWSPRGLSFQSCCGAEVGGGRSREAGEKVQLGGVGRETD